jgi:hypothetical protein
VLPEVGDVTVTPAKAAALNKKQMNKEVAVLLRK